MISRCRQKHVKQSVRRHFSLTCSIRPSITQQVNMTQNSNESDSAWLWNYACLIVTLETQLNSSSLNQSGAAWMNMHFECVSGNHNPLSRAVWQPPAVHHSTCGSLQSFLFVLWMVCFGGSQAKPPWNEMSKTFFYIKLRPLDCFIFLTTHREAVCTDSINHSLLLFGYLLDDFKMFIFR